MVAWIWCALVLGLAAERPRVIAWLDHPELSAGAETILHVEVEGSCAVDSELGAAPHVEGLEVERLDGGPVLSSRRGSYVAEFRLRVATERPGRFLIHPPDVICPDETRHAPNPVELRVRDLGDASGAVPVLEVRARPARVFAGQPFTVEFRARREPWETLPASPELRLPWWREVVPLPADAFMGRDEVAAAIAGSGRTLQLSLTQTETGPELSGRITVLAPRAGALDFAGSELRVAGGATASPVERRLAARAQGGSVEVLALPEAGRPASFVDAVGDFTVTAGAVPVELGPGDPLELRIVIRDVRPGQSNLPFTRFADLSAVPGFHAVGGAEYERTDSECILRQELVPRDATVAELPALEVSWFDPWQERYETRLTGPVPIHVTARGMPSAAPDGGSRAAPPRTFGSWALWFVTGAVAWEAARRLLRRRRTRAPQARTARTATEVFREELAAWRGQGAGDAVGAAQVLARYLAAKLERDSGLCSGVEVAAALREKGVDDRTCARVAGFFREAERRAFDRQPAPWPGAEVELIALHAELERGLRERGAAAPA